MVCDEAGTEIRVPVGRLRVLLAALLIRANHMVPVDELVDLVWDGTPSPRAGRTLRVHVVRLRQALGPAAAARIVTGPAGYLCRAGDDELDVLRFGKLCGQARSAAWEGAWPRAAGLLEEALGLWRGTPLTDVPSELLRQRELASLDRRHVQAVEDHLDARMRLGQHEQLIPQLRDLVARHPLRERPYAHLMRALDGCGRRAEALEVYREARGVLARELGIEPGRELRDVQRAILAGAEPPTPMAAASSPVLAVAAVPRQLPAAPGHFTGRLAEVGMLTGLLPRTGQATGSGSSIVISAIGGMPGVGKTALAVHWAHRVGGRFPDGQLYVNLRGFAPFGTPATPAEAVRGFLDALGVAPERIPATLDAQAGLYRSLLAGKRMLIVLDNARDEEQVRPLLPASPASLVIITSRNQLAGLAAADGARPLTLGVLTHDEAVRLLTGRIGAARAGAEPGAVDQIAVLCAHLPLALAVAAARAGARPAFPLAALAAELRDAAGPLDALDAGDPAASVRAVFSWSYDQLSGEARRMFRLLGVHPGPDISVPAAASLAGVDVPAARGMLRELDRAHLIIENVPGRYAFHDLLRAYAADRAGSSDTEPDRAAAIGRVLDHYLHTASRAALVLNPLRDLIALAPAGPGAVPEQPAGHRLALAWFEAEYQVLLAAAALADSTGFDTHAWQLPWAMMPFLRTRGRYQEWAATQRMALAAATRLRDAAAQAISGRLLAAACIDLGDYDQALGHCGSSLRLYRQLGDRLGEAMTQQWLGILAGRQGRHADALGHAVEALRLYQNIGHKMAEASALNLVGWLHALLGDYAQARVFCRRSVDFCAQTGDRMQEGNAWDSLGYAEHHLGNLSEAAACYQRALDIARETGDRGTEADVLTHLGDIRHAADDLPHAREAWRQALAILDDIHHPDADKVRAKLASAQD